MTTSKFQIPARHLYWLCNSFENQAGGNPNIQLPNKSNSDLEFGSYLLFGICYLRFNRGVVK